MNIYIVFSESCYPCAKGDIVGVFMSKKDADDMKDSMKRSDSFIIEYKIIE